MTATHRFGTCTCGKALRKFNRGICTACDVAKDAARIAAAKAIVATGKCPTCGRVLRRNPSLTGWWQCSQLGAVGFRADASQPSCDWQTSTV